MLWSKVQSHDVIVQGPIPRCYDTRSDPTTLLSKVKSHDVMIQGPIPRRYCPRSNPTMLRSKVQSHDVIVQGPIPRCYDPRSNPTMLLSKVQSHDVMIQGPIPRRYWPRSNPTMFWSKVQCHDVIVKGPIPRCYDPRSNSTMLLSKLQCHGCYDPRSNPAQGMIQRRFCGLWCLIHVDANFILYWCSQLWSHSMKLSFKMILSKGCCLYGAVGPIILSKSRSHDDPVKGSMPRWLRTRRFDDLIQKFIPTSGPPTILWFE